MNDESSSSTESESFYTGVAAISTSNYDPKNSMANLSNYYEAMSPEFGEPSICQSLQTSNKKTMDALNGKLTVEETKSKEVSELLTSLNEERKVVAEHKI